MDANELINNAIKNGGGMLVNSNLFALEGNIPNNRYRIMPLTEAYKDALMCFQYGIQSNNVILGVFSSEGAAEEFKTTIQTLYRDEQGNNIIQ